MSIYLTPLYEDARSELGMPNNAKSANLFISGINQALDILSEDIDRSTGYRHIERTDTSITDLDDRNRAALYDGAVYYMVRRGGLGSDPRVLQKQIEVLRDEFNTGRDRHYVRHWNDCQATDSSDIIGLGYLG